MIVNAKIIFTDHAEERLHECQLDKYQAEKLLNEAELTIPPKNVRKYKQQKYHGNNGTFFYSSGPIIFTTRWVIDRWTFKPILLVITVTNQLATIR